MEFIYIPAALILGIVLFVIVSKLFSRSASHDTTGETWKHERSPLPHAKYTGVVMDDDLSIVETLDGKTFQFERPKDGAQILTHSKNGQMIVTELDSYGQPFRRLYKGSQSQAGIFVRDWLAGKK